MRLVVGADVALACMHVTMWCLGACMHACYVMSRSMHAYIFLGGVQEHEYLAAQAVHALPVI